MHVCMCVIYVCNIWSFVCIDSGVCLIGTTRSWRRVIWDIGSGTVSSNAFLCWLIGIKSTIRKPAAPVIGVKILRSHFKNAAIVERNRLWKVSGIGAFLSWPRRPRFGRVCPNAPPLHFDYQSWRIGQLWQKGKRLYAKISEPSAPVSGKKMGNTRVHHRPARTRWFHNAWWISSHELQSSKWHNVLTYRWSRKWNWSKNWYHPVHSIYPSLVRMACPVSNFPAL